MLSGRLFWSPAKAQLPFVFNLDSGTVRRPKLADQRGLVTQCGIGNSVIYSGARPCKALNVINSTETGSKCYEAKIGVMCEKCFV